jgi:hypothetical protein
MLLLPRLEPSCQVRKSERFSVAFMAQEPPIWYYRKIRHLSVRGDLKKLLPFGVIVAFILQAYTSPLATIVLNSASLSAGRLPSDWQIKVNHGRPDVTVCRDENEGPCLHLKSVKSSFALERSVDVNPTETPFLSWRWKVLVAFADRRVLTYIWDSSAPKGTAEYASNIPLVHVFAVVCESGVSAANRWLSENRNVAADYQRAYGKPAPRVKGLRIQINSQHTGSVAESYFGDVAFRSSPQ